MSATRHLLLVCCLLGLGLPLFAGVLPAIARAGFAAADTLAPSTHTSTTPIAAPGTLPPAPPWLTPPPGPAVT